MKPSAIAAALVVFMSPLSLAQTTQDEIVVTATRFPELRLDAPIGMTVITARQIADSAVRSLPPTGATPCQASS